MGIVGSGAFGALLILVTTSQGISASATSILTIIFWSVAQLYGREKGIHWNIPLRKRGENFNF